MFSFGVQDNIILQLAIMIKPATGLASLVAKDVIVLL